MHVIDNARKYKELFIKFGSRKCMYDYCSIKRRLRYEIKKEMPHLNFKDVEDAIETTIWFEFVEF